jgi:rare lipoprotein A
MRALRGAGAAGDGASVGGRSPRLAAPLAAWRVSTWAACCTAALLAACASGPRPDGGTERDGPPASVPPGLQHTPDAVPRVEPLRSGGPNKPYVVLGRRYVPFADDRPFRERGLASWYGRKFHGRPTASGERYDMFAMTAAHKTMPLPSYARVRNPANGREVIVRINDRGPFADGRVIDLSYVAALRLGVLGGVAPVIVERLTAEDIRRGDWARALQADDPAPAVPGTASLGAAGTPGPSQAPALPDAPGFWVQLAAFRDPESAEALRRQAMALLDAGVGVFEGDGVFRVQAGPWPTRASAEQASRAAAARLAVQAFVVQRGTP